MIEALVELLLELFGELLLQLLLQALVEMGLHLFASRLRKPNPWMAAVGYALLGAMVGGLSLLAWPTHLTQAGLWRVLNLIGTPIGAGLAMMGMGWWRRRHGEATLGIDRFWYGYLFALGLALARYHFAA